MRLAHRSLRIPVLGANFPIGFGTRPRSDVLDETVMNLAATQYGVVGRDQLVAGGYSRWAVRRAREKGLLVALTPRVVRMASSPDTFASRCMAAQLHARGASFVSSWTAARLYGLRKMPDRPIHVTIAESARLDSPGWIRVAHSSWFDFERDAVRFRDTPLMVASPMRMLFGLAASFNQFRFERAAEDAWHRRLITPGDAAAYLEAHRCRGKDGVSTIERWLERTSKHTRPPQSGLEQELLRAIDVIGGLPRPERQHPVRLLTGETIHIDIAWPQVRLGVEPGASWWHGGDLGQRRDQARDRACGEVGWMIVRHDESMAVDPSTAARQLRTIYASRVASF